MSRLFDAPVQPLDTDERYTPKWVFDHLDVMFDTDPCSPVGGGDFVPALVKHTAETDGLAQPWRGLVWVNPPFSSSTPWAERFIAHGNGVFLGPIANARWAVDMLNVADLIWLCRDFAFVHPTHAGKRSSMPLMFCAMGRDGSAALRRLATSGAHPGCLLVRSERDLSEEGTS